MHSIIIPHRDRNDRLRYCLWTIKRSAQVCGISDYEVLVVDNGSRIPPGPDSHVTVLAPLRTKPFHKTRLLNCGITYAQGEFLTFLDCDALVGERWLEGVLELEDTSITRLCYRVRRLAREVLDELVSSKNPSELIASWFRQYDDYPLRYEAYYDPDNPVYKGPFSSPCGHHVFGNSQFSMRRDAIGDLRFEETFENAGAEDLLFISEVWKHFGETYCGKILTDAPHGILDIQNRREPDWHNMQSNQRQHAIYRRKRGFTLA